MRKGQSFIYYLNNKGEGWTLCGQSRSLCHRPGQRWHESELKLSTRFSVDIQIVLPM